LKIQPFETRNRCLKVAEGAGAVSEEMLRVWSREGVFVLENGWNEQRVLVG
jgi:hypothetical protein